MKEDKEFGDHNAEKMLVEFAESGGPNFPYMFGELSQVCSRIVSKMFYIWHELEDLIFYGQ